MIPKDVLVSVKVNPKWGERLKKHGALFHARTLQEDAGMRAEQAAQAKQVGRDAFRGERTDTTGVKRPDSGTPVYGWNERGRQKVCLRQVRKDLETNLGMRCVDVRLNQKANDKMFNLRLLFATEGKKMEVTGELGEVINTIFGRTYEHVHAYRNPGMGTDGVATLDLPGRTTINASHGLVGKDEPAPKFKFDLHVTAEGSLLTTRQAEAA